MNFLKIALPLALLLAMPLRAESAEGPVDTRFNLRVGGTASTLKDHLDGRTFGMGFEVGYTQPWGRVSAEVGYIYNSGQEYLDNNASLRFAPGATVDNRFSADGRKNQLDGMALRFAYRSLPKEDWGWNAGLMLNFTRFKQEYLATVADGNTPQITSAVKAPMSATYLDTYNGTLSKSAIGFSPFVGITYTIDRNSAIQVNLLLLNYTAANYVHVAGTLPKPAGTEWNDTGLNSVYLGGHIGQDHVDTTTRFVPRFELAYSFCF